MATGLSKDGAALILNWITGNFAIQPMNLELRLMSANGDMATAGTELTGSTYTPQPITFADAVDVGSGAIRADSDVDMIWRSLDGSASKSVAGVELWDIDNQVRLAWYAYAAPEVVAAEAMYAKAAGEFTVGWLTTGTDGSAGIDVALRIRAINWLLGGPIDDVVQPLLIHPVNADGTFQTAATPHAGDSWEEQYISFSPASYAASKVSAPNAAQVIFDGLDSASALAIPAFEIWDGAGMRVAYMASANHPVVTPPTIPAKTAWQIAAGAVKLKVV